jgi:hypothetical protein
MPAVCLSWCVPRYAQTLSYLRPLGAQVLDPLHGLHHILYTEDHYLWYRSWSHSRSRIAAHEDRYSGAAGESSMALLHSSPFAGMAAPWTMAGRSVSGRGSRQIPNHTMAYLHRTGTMSRAPLPQSLDGLQPPWGSAPHLLPTRKKIRPTRSSVPRPQPPREPLTDMD